MKYVVSTLVAFVLPVLICIGLYSIRDKHYAVTNVCNADFYSDLCGKE